MSIPTFKVLLAPLFTCILLVFGVSLSGLAVPVYAQESEQQKEVNGRAGVKSNDQTEAVSYVGTAQDLAQYGTSQRDPVALISAARILVQQNAGDAEAPDEEERQSDESGEGSNVPTTAQGMLDAARQMAGDDDTVAALIQDVENMMSASRGSMSGPRRFRGSVGGSDREDIWSLGNFRGRSPARVILRGNGRTDLDCYIYDEHNNLIDSDTDRTDLCVLGWTPSWTGPFRLRVRDYSNNGYKNYYAFAHN